MDPSMHPGLFGLGPKMTMLAFLGTNAVSMRLYLAWHGDHWILGMGGFSTLMELQSHNESLNQVNRHLEGHDQLHQHLHRHD
jgi:hypothetical protein